MLKSKSWAFILILICFSMAMSQTPIPEIKPAPVSTNLDYAAIVNGEKIVLDEFNTAVQSAKENLLKQSDIDFQSEEGKFILATTQRSILEDMINQKIIRQQATEMNIEVTDKEIKNDVAQLKKGFPSDKLFQETLSEENINETELKQGIHERLIIEKIKKSLAANVEVSDREINNFLKQNKTLLSQPKRMQFSQILTNTKEEADEALAQLTKGKAFVDVVKEYSIDAASRDSGGNIGFIEPGLFSNKVSQTIFSLQQDEVSPVVETDKGFVIFKCTKIMPDETDESAQSREEAKKYLLSKKENELYDKWFNKIKNKSKIEINPDLTQETPEQTTPEQKNEIPHGNISQNGRS